MSNASTKVHWTQRPENKKKLHQMHVKANRTIKKRKKQSTFAKAQVQNTEHRRSVHESRQGQDQPEVLVAFGHVAGWLSAYAHAVGLPGSALAFRVGQLLQREARR